MGERRWGGVQDWLAGGREGSRWTQIRGGVRDTPPLFLTALNRTTATCPFSDVRSTTHPPPPPLPAPLMGLAEGRVLGERRKGRVVGERRWGWASRFPKGVQGDPRLAKNGRDSGRTPTRGQGSLPLTGRGEMGLRT